MKIRIKDAKTKDFIKNMSIDYTPITHERLDDGIIKKIEYYYFKEYMTADVYITQQ